MPVKVTCEICKKEQTVDPGRVKTYRFCSYKCAGEWRKVAYRGENHNRWQKDQAREKTCQYCGVRFTLRPKQPITTFKNQKFCSKSCADKGGFRRKGEAHPNYSPAARRRNRGGKHASWASAVISRDGAKCQNCGAVGTELQAHHLKPYSDHPELRWDVGNGLTLCAPCHWAVHAALDANEVNSGDLLPGDAGDNPEPSFGRKPVEGVTTRGRAYRRWDGPCAWCGSFLSKRWSAAKPYIPFVFCDTSCAAKHKAAFRKWRPSRGPIPSTAVIPSTSASRESDDIV